jgi:hypothetical protein
VTAHPPGLEIEIFTVGHRVDGEQISINVRAVSLRAWRMTAMRGMSTAGELIRNTASVTTPVIAFPLSWASCASHRSIW